MTEHAGPGVVAVAGEALVDFVPGGGPGMFRAAPGGSPANVAVGLSRLEVRTRLLARIADDLLGHRLRADLDGNGVDLSFAVRAAEHPAGHRRRRARRRGRVRLPGRWHRRLAVARRRARRALDGEVVALHAGSLALTMPPGADVLQRLLAKARQAMTVSTTPTAGRC